MLGQPEPAYRMETEGLGVNQDATQGDHMTLPVAGFDYGGSLAHGEHADRRTAIQDAGLFTQRLLVGVVREQRRQGRQEL
jgi:hypothetical protein